MEIIQVNAHPGIPAGMDISNDNLVVEQRTQRPLIVDELRPTSYDTC